MGNLTVGNPANIAAVAAAGAIPPLVELLRVGSNEEKESATAALGNLAIHNSVNAAAIVRAGALPLRMELLHGKESTEQGGRFAAFALNLINTSLYREVP